jgi:hypothetical protein
VLCIVRYLLIPWLWVYGFKDSFFDVTFDIWLEMKNMQLHLCGVLMDMMVLILQIELFVCHMVSSNTVIDLFCTGTVLQGHGWRTIKCWVVYLGDASCAESHALQHCYFAKMF